MCVHVILIKQCYINIDLLNDVIMTSYELWNARDQPRAQDMKLIYVLKKNFLNFREPVLQI